MKTSLMVVCLSVMVGLSLAGCDRDPKNQAELQKDVAEAQREGAEDVADAQREASEEIAEAQRDTNVTASIDPMNPNNAAGATNADAIHESAEQRYKVEEAEAEAALKVAKERCDAYGGDQRQSCIDTAQAEHDAKMQSAKSRREMAMQDADRVDQPRL